MNKADCPACKNKVNVGPKPKLGQRLVCPSCKTELEIVWLEPLELDWPYDDEEEFEDFEEDEEMFDEEDY